MTTEQAASDVHLREVVESDLEIFHEQENDPEASRRANFPARERERFMTHWRTRVLGGPDTLVRAVIVDGEVAGNILSWTDEGRRNLGYWLGREYWGRGIGSRAVALFLALESTRPLYADPSAAKTASVRLLERLGFERDGSVIYGDQEHLVLVLT